MSNSIFDSKILKFEAWNLKSIRKSLNLRGRRNNYLAMFNSLYLEILSNMSIFEQHEKRSTKYVLRGGAKIEEIGG